MSPMNQEVVSVDELEAQRLAVLIEIDEHRLVNLNGSVSLAS